MKPNPFIGPRPFERGETLYGRGREIDELYLRLNAERIVLLHAPSGAGKTSLVQAGLLPLLAGSFDVWGPTRVNTEPAIPGGNRYTLSAVRGFEEQVPESLRRPAEVLAGQTLSGYFEKRPRRRSARPNVILLFDQFEEILTVDPLALDAKREFFDQLGHLLRNPRVWALFVLREDYLAPLDPFARQVPTHLKNRFRIDLLGLAAAREAIVEPARKAGREFPAIDKLIEDLARVKVQQADGSFVDQTGQHVEPVQLQVVCRSLWDAMPAGDLSIDAEDLERFGDVTQALAAYYAGSVARIAGGDPAGERVIRDWCGEKLITAGGVRAQVLREAGASGGLENGRIEQLRATHLVRAEQRAGATWYELAHDRLIEPVRRDNAAWRKEHLAEVQRRAELWRLQGEPSGLLLAGDDLAGALEWEAQNAAQVTEVDSSFLDASRKQQELVDKERRQNRRMRRLALGATVTTVLALVALFFAWKAYVQMEQVARRSASRELALQSSQLLDQQLDLAVLLALEAGEIEPTVEARRSLLTALQHNPRLWSFLPPGAAPRRRVAFRPGSPMLAMAGESEAIELWDVDTGRPLPGSPLLLPGAFEVRTVAFSPDGRWLAAGGKTAANAGLLGLWDVSVSPPRRYVTPEGGAVVRSLAFCGRGGGTQLAWNTKDEVSLWPLRGTEKPQVLLRKEEGRRVTRVAMAPDCARLAVGDESGGRIELWSFTVPSGAVVRQPLAEGLSGLGGLAFDPAGRRIAAGAGRLLSLWNLDTRQQKLVEMRSSIRSLAFQPDGTGLSVAGTSRITQFLLYMAEDELNAIEGMEPLTGHDGPVSELAFRSGGEVLASVGEDGKVILWKPEAQQRLARHLAGHGQEVWGVAFSPGGRSLASVEGSETERMEAAVRLWDVETGQGVSLPGTLGPSRAVAFSPDGRSVAAGSRDPAGGTLVLWRLAGPQGQAVEAARWQAGKPVNAVTFSPDGTSLFAAQGEDLVQWTLDPPPPRSQPLTTQKGNIWSLLVRSTQTLLVSDETGKVIEWDPAAAAGTAVLEPYPPARQILASVDESPDGRYVAAASWVGGDRCVDLWEMPSGAFRGCLPGHQAPVSAVAFARDGSLISADGDGQLIVWDPASRREIGRLPQRRGIHGLAASERHLAAASSDGTVLLLDLDWKTAARNLAGRELTQQECETWIRFEPKPASCARER